MSIPEKPLIVMFEHDDQIVCHLWPRRDDNHAGYGLMIADLIRHTAGCFDVTVGDVNEWVQKELRRPTTEIMRAS